MKKIVSVTVLLSSSLFLGGCMLRAPGPCLGYGCPALSGSGDSYQVQPPVSSQKSTAKNATAHDTSVHAGN